MKTISKFTSAVALAVGVNGVAGDGEWEFQAFNADKSLNVNENLDRCFSCHKSQAGQDFVYTLDRMKSAE